MGVRFEAPCTACFEPVQYANGRASNHDCIDINEENNEESN